MNNVSPTDGNPVSSQGGVSASLPPAEAGYQTTEFWGKVVVQVITEALAVTVAFGGSLTSAQQVAIIGLAQAVVGALEGVYAVARNVRKRGTHA